MTSASFNFSGPRALIALLLELLNHARCDLLAFDDLTLALAIRTYGDIVFIICSTASTVWTDNVAIILKLEVRTRVELRERDYDFKVGAGTCLFYPIRGSITLN